MSINKQLAGLEVLQVEFRVFVVVVYGRAAVTGLVLPIGDGAVVEATGGGGGQRAAVSEQVSDAREQTEVLAEAVERGALGGGEGVAANEAAAADPRGSER